jgi:D-glycero-alpha-D-manno-heptose-7-phosphate kinase
VIIVRAPMRISLGGGGTDLPSYYRQFGGFCVSAAIDKFVYITAHRTFESGITLKYSEVERVKTAEEIRHPILREVLKRVGNPYIEIASHADVPAGTGLGSSSSFTVALIKAVDTDLSYGTCELSNIELAEKACDIEINQLHEPIGKQDQYIAAFGGLRKFEFDPDGKVHVRYLNLEDATIHGLEDGLILFFTGYVRSASDVLLSQADNVGNLHQTKDIGRFICRALENGNLQEFGELMDAHWELKRERSNGVSNPQIDEWYAVAKRHGAIGGKLVGAGGGGFLMLYTRDRQRLRHAMLNVGLKELYFRFDWEGCKVIAQ